MNISSNSTKSRSILLICLLVLGTLTARRAPAWTGTGPLLGFQTATLDYGATRFYYAGHGELGGPQIPSTSARLNVGVVTYAYDPAFLGYFGTDGVASVDAAMNVLNSLPSFTSTTSLQAYLTQGNQRINYTAQALEMLDLKSTTLMIMIERMGLMGETHVFDLEARNALPNTTCEYSYDVILRNFDPDTLNPTNYVNGAAYGFQIYDSCTTADAIEQYLDTAALPYTSSAVATKENFQTGGYFIGLTRDDVGGLRYLYNPTRYENENLDPTCYPNFAQGGSSPWTPVGTNTATNATGGGGPFTFGGVGHVQFVKTAYNSLVGTTYGTNVFTYSIPFLTNGQVSMIEVTRTNTAPDIIFDVGDLLQTGSIPAAVTPYTRTMAFIAPPADPGGGLLPSVITPTAVVITFNDATPIYASESPTFLSDQSFLNYPVFNWGSFNGGTNIIIFPRYTSVAALEESASTTTGTPMDAFDPVGTNNPATPTSTTGGAAGGGGGGGAGVP